MKNNRRVGILSALFVTTLLSSCAEDSDVLVGKRISLMAQPKNIVVKSELINTIKIPTSEFNDDWAQAGGMSNHLMQNPLIGNRIHEAWKKSIGKGSSKRHYLIAEPIVYDNFIYTIDAKGVITCFNMAGKVVWKKSALNKNSPDSLSIAGAGLAIDNGRLFVALGSGEIVSYSINNDRASKVKIGDELARVDLKSPVRSAPTVYGGRLFVMTADNSLWALEQKELHISWHYKSFMDNVAMLGRASPAIDNGVGVAVFASGSVIAFRPENGALLWEQSISLPRSSDTIVALNDIKARPVIDGDRVYVLSSGGVLSAINIKDAGVIWQQEIAGVNQPWIAGDIIYILSDAAQVFAVNKYTGDVLWKNDLKRKIDDEVITWVGPIMAGSRLILTNSLGKAVALSPQTGTIIGFEEVGDVGTLIPIVSNETLFFLTYDGDLVAYR
ncbi:MAG: PQQ-binding-like beta-propeller repeat protein [Alphaproteobacteria bacterium]|nr:PQQ-binding-like beta-propeller repeat protein [Alphaproteobacteria bacterium]